MKLLKSAAAAFGLLAVLGTAVVALPGRAAAQTADSYDQEFLIDLYDFLRSQDPMTYSVAVDEMGDDGNIWVAQSFCSALSAGGESG